MCITRFCAPPAPHPHSIPDSSDRAAGLSELATALPAGWAADKWSPSLVISIGGALVLVAVAAICFAVISSAWSDHSLCYLFMCCGLAMYGFSEGIICGPAQALLANSLPTGSRDKFYNYCFVCSILGSTAGPLLSVILFSFWQGYDGQAEDWPMDKLRVVMLIGLGFEVPCACLMFFFRDDCALGAESMNITTAADEEHVLEHTLIDGHPPDAPDQDARVEDTDKEDEDEDEDEEDEEAEQAAWEVWMQEAGKGKFLFLRAHHVPYIVWSCDLCCSLGSGMTVNFFRECLVYRLC